ncbi:MAG: hypothetical protein IIV27_02295 [Clostridia bacterium]|jgi:hypothetical protein|nr:hypothetical protein [Clostridia bacterium]
MAKVAVEFAGFDEVLKKLNKLGADTKQITEDALQKSFDIVTKKAEAAIAKPNLPAGGKFSTGRTEESLTRTLEVTWTGTEASAPVGFNIKKGGLPSIFMMYGTPRYMKVQAVYDAFYSSATEGEVLNAQREVFFKAMEELE